MSRKPKGTGVRGHRLNPTQTDRCRAAIATSQIINRLNSFVLGKENENGVKVEMAPHQVSAALGLLKKVLPDLQSVEGNLSVTHRHEDALAQLEQAAAQSAVADHDSSYH